MKVRDKDSVKIDTVAAGSLGTPDRCLIVPCTTSWGLRNLIGPRLRGVYDRCWGFHRGRWDRVADDLEFDLNKYWLRRHGCG